MFCVLFLFGALFGKTLTTMRAFTPEIRWHWSEGDAPMPILGADFHSLPGSEWRLATCGADNAVKMWKCDVDEDGRLKMVFLADLKRHQRTVNVARFSPNGTDACCVCALCVCLCVCVCVCLCVHVCTCVYVCACACVCVCVCVCA